MKKFQAVRGMRDLLPEEAGLWRSIESRVQQQMHAFGYGEIRLPLLESTELFVRSVGDVTDLVKKEMYTFTDRNEDSLTLRPEGTAGCLRAAIENGLVVNQTARLWYSGPMFRHERPQKGRYRQFEQIGAEVIGEAGPDIDAELLELCWSIWQAFDLEEVLSLELNSLGTPAARQAYQQALQGYLQQYIAELDQASRDCLPVNPMRILDSKVPATRELLAEAPVLTDFLDQESADHFAGLCRLLDGLHIPYVINPRIVRGLDYYTKTVFEWTTTKLGAQNAICSGGRYDGLSELLGGPAVPAIGFALGMDRLALMVSLLKKQPPSGVADVYLIPLSEELRPQALQLARKLRLELTFERIVCHTGHAKIKSAMKKADRSGAAVVLLLGEAEAFAGGITMKLLRQDVEQKLVPQSEIVAEVKAAMRRNHSG